MTQAAARDDFGIHVDQADTRMGVLVFDGEWYCGVASLDASWSRYGAADTRVHRVAIGRIELPRGGGCRVASTLADRARAD